MKAWLDTALGRITMYRLMVYSLIVVVLAAFAFHSKIGYKPSAMLSTLIVLLVVAYVSNRIFALLFGVKPHSESTIITALLLFFIISPTTDKTALAQIALAALFASGSKYVLAVRGRHIFNPAAAGAVFLTVFNLGFSAAYNLAFAGWWVGTSVLLPFTAVLGLIVLYRTRRIPLGLIFVVIAGAIILSRDVSSVVPFSQAMKFALVQSPTVFFACFMLSEPLTLPPARWQQLSLAAVVAVLFALPIHFGSFYLGEAGALLVGNAAAFFFGQRKGIELVLTAKRRLSPTSMEFVFEPLRPLAFQAGQYLELSLPHKGVDSRGSRRVFSIASSPGDSKNVKIGIKIADKGSSFKRALSELEIGSRVQATGVSGDFLLPRDTKKPLLLIAGGIGITPFASHLGALNGDNRDIVVVYAASNTKEVSYVETLEKSGARVVVVSNTNGSGLPKSFHHVAAPSLGHEVLASVVPDIANRHVMISGPPGLVDSISGAARALKAKTVRKDYFSGY